MQRIALGEEAHQLALLNGVADSLEDDRFNSAQLTSAVQLKIEVKLVVPRHNLGGQLSFAVVPWGDASTAWSSAFLRDILDANIMGPDGGAHRVFDVFQLVFALVVGVATRRTKTLLREKHPQTRDRFAIDGNDAGYFTNGGPIATGTTQTEHREGDCDQESRRLRCRVAEWWIPHSEFNLIHTNRFFEAAGTIRLPLRFRRQLEYLVQKSSREECNKPCWTAKS